MDMSRIPDRVQESGDFVDWPSRCEERRATPCCEIRATMSSVIRHDQRRTRLMNSRLARALVAIALFVAAPHAVSQSSWVLNANLRSDDIPPGGDGQPGDLFGASTGLGEYFAVLGATAHDHTGSKPFSGAAYVFQRLDTAWYPETELLASDAAAGDRFGCAVASDLYQVVVGADANHVGVGKAYVFTWMSLNWVETKLVPIGGGTLNAFGAAVDVFVGGTDETIVVGAPLDNYAGGPPDAGSAFLFEWDGSSWVPLPGPLRPADPSMDKQFGGSVAVEGNLAVVGARGDSGETGAAYVFERIGGVWTEVQKLTASDGVGHDRFGTCVSLSGDRIAVGAPGDDPGPPPDLSNVGSVYVFERSGGTWTELQKLEGDSSSNSCGEDVSISGTRLAYGDEQRIHIYRWIAPSTHCVRETEIQGGPAFGEKLTVFGDHVVASDPSHGGDEGIAYVYWGGWGACVPYCFCPPSSAICGNPDDDAGCANAGGSGASLSVRGTTYPDALTIDAEGVAPNNFALFFQGHYQVNGGTGIPFNDGLRCAGGAVQRIGTKLANGNGDVSYGPYAGDPQISSKTDAVPGMGLPRTYQVWYRDPAGPCGTQSNSSSALWVIW